MKIEKSIMVAIRRGSTVFAIEGEFWTNDLSKIIPELRSTRTEFEINISFEIQRQEGWYWVKEDKDKPFSPLYWNGNAWWRYHEANCGDEGVYKINETRIPEPTDG